MHLLGLDKFIIPRNNKSTNITRHCSLLVLETTMDVIVRILRYLCYLRIDIQYSQSLSFPARVERRCVGGLGWAGACCGSNTSLSPLPSLLLTTRGCSVGLDYWIMCCSGLVSDVLVICPHSAVPPRWRINIVIVSPLGRCAGSRHSVFWVKDGCCS